MIVNNWVGARMNQPTPTPNAPSIEKPNPNHHPLYIISRSFFLRLCLVPSDFLLVLWVCTWWVFLLLLLPRDKDIVFRFIIEYNSSRDFSPLHVIIIGLFLYDDFWNMIFWLVLNLEISYRVIIS
jgi:hypothetical protein